MSEESKRKVKVKFLRSVGQHMAGDVAEIPEHEAEHALREREHFDGEKMIPAEPFAVLHSELEDMETHELTAEQLRKMTAADMAKLGKKNIVVTPLDPTFEQKLDRLRKLDKAKAPKKSDDDEEEEEDIDEDIDGLGDGTEEGDSEPSEEEEETDEAAAAPKPKKKRNRKKKVVTPEA